MISNIMLALNANAPKDKHEKARNDPRWIELYSLIDVLVKAQIVACPYSEGHQLESVYSGLSGELERTYKHISRGVSLHGSEQIVRDQMAESMRAMLEGRPPNYEDGARDAALEDVDKWINTVWVDVDVRHAVGPDDLRSGRSAGHALLTEAFSRWQGEKDRTFAERYDEERRSLGRAYIYLHSAWEKGALDEMASVGSPDFKRVFPSEEVSTVNGLIRLCLHLGIPQSEVRSVVGKFFMSDAFFEAPYVKISCALWAAMAMRASGGQKKPPNRGTFSDVKTVASVLPVCDAMVVDRECAGLMRDIPMEYRPGNWSRVVGSNDVQELISYLNELKGLISEEYSGLLDRVYGESWRRPDLSLFSR
ncbi:hypothetical protein HPC50_28360 [Corallococcus exiguus]|uniref:hypothetical protein n=1 Tax=Corallococcus exiguus TaxID=83462 RepID=UPI001494646E|nr:hypothetical protein [Corallococcus exiguus]NPC50970.1 hypothetical protein [Corallococcus exiguus]